MRKVKVGSALENGTAQGLAYIGVLGILERESIPIDMIAGASPRAFANALHA